jgi:hypothetical protein
MVRETLATRVVTEAEAKTEAEAALVPETTVIAA